MFLQVFTRDEDDAWNESHIITFFQQKFPLPQQEKNEKAEAVNTQFETEPQKSRRKLQPVGAVLPGQPSNRESQRSKTDAAYVTNNESATVGDGQTVGQSSREYVDLMENSIDKSQESGFQDYRILDTPQPGKKKVK